jgi:hypothetical protein
LISGEVTKLDITHTAFGALEMPVSVAHRDASYSIERNV